VFADWFQNYGLVVIVNHGDEFFTIYGHLDTVAVRTGEWVDASIEVGTVGETGSLIGPSLYFEIREGSDAVNPTQWLRRR
jgi:septal ring factor EnvC (AmiA/AmiB activator)